MSNLQLTKSSSESDLKRYFTAVLELSKSDNKFPINLDEVWPLVYAERGVAIRALRKNFFENEDFISFDQNVKRETGSSVKTDFNLSLSCMEYFIARKVRPVFEVYRQVFHKTAQHTTLPQNYKQALAQLLAQVEINEQLQIENQTLHDDVQTQQNINNLLMGENDAMRPKVRIYDQVIQTPDEKHLFTTSSVANEIGMSGQQLNKMLMACGVIYKQGDGDYLFTSDYRDWDLGKTISCIVNEEKGLVKTYIKWNTRGRAYIHALNDTNWDKRRAWHLLRDGKEVAAL